MKIDASIPRCRHTARLGLLIVALSSVATAQQPVFRYLRTSFYKVPAMEADNFRKFNMEVANRARADAVAAGSAAGWHFCEMVGWGSDSPYNFVATTAFEKPFELTTKPGEAESLIQKLGLKLSLADVVRQGTQYRAKQTVSRVQEMVGETLAPGEFLLVLYAKAAPNKLGEVVQLHRTIYLPLQAERIRLGRIKGYGFSTTLIPGGEAAEYDFISWLVLKDSAAVLTYSAAIADAEAYRRVHPDKDINAVREMLRDAYRTVRTEVRHCLAAGRK